jgi:hypothetical protein
MTTWLAKTWVRIRAWLALAAGAAVFIWVLLQRAERRGAAKMIAEQKIDKAKKRIKEVKERRDKELEEIDSLRRSRDPAAIRKSIWDKINSRRRRD